MSLSIIRLGNIVFPTNEEKTLLKEKGNEKSIFEPLNWVHFMRSEK